MALWVQCVSVLEVRRSKQGLIVFFVLPQPDLGKLEYAEIAPQGHKDEFSRSAEALRVFFFYEVLTRRT